MLAIGCENGDIPILRVATEKGYTKFEDVYKSLSFKIFNEKKKN